MKSVVWVLSLLGAAKAASDFSGSPHSSAPYIYSEINSMEYDAETDYQSQNDRDDYTETSSKVVGSLSFEGGCVVSAQAIMCNGGGDPLYMDSSFASDEDSSDDEDDQDDGHSSMLSNASLRSKAYVSCSAATTPRPYNAHHRKSTRGTNCSEGELRVERNQASISAALKFFGGSIGSTTDHGDSKKLVVGRYFGVLR